MLGKETHVLYGGLHRSHTIEHYEIPGKRNDPYIR